MMKAAFLAQKSALCLLPVLALFMAPANNLSRYTECKLGRFVVMESSERDQPFSRSVSTDKGDRPVVITHGVSLHIAYEETPFVNFKAEKLADYGNGKRCLIASNIWPQVLEWNPWSRYIQQSTALMFMA